MIRVYVFYRSDVRGDDSHYIVLQNTKEQAIRARLDGFTIKHNHTRFYTEFTDDGEAALFKLTYGGVHVERTL